MGEGRLSGRQGQGGCGVQCGAQGLFFPAGGRGDHIKFFITDLQEMRESSITPTARLLVFSFFFYKTAAGKKNAGGR